MVADVLQGRRLAGRLAQDADGKLEHKYETPEFEAALEFTAKLFKDGLVHPDIVASKGADAKQLFGSGKIVVHAGRPRRLAGHAGRAGRR